MPRPKDTPLGLLERDLSQTLNLHGEIRRLIQSQILVLKAKLDEDLPLQPRLDILEALTNMSDTLTKSIQQSAKFVMSETNKDDRETGESLSIDELLSGTTKRGRSE